MSHTLQILVTGATGRTVSLVMEKLQQLNTVSVGGLARAPKKTQEVFDSTENFFLRPMTSIKI